MRALRHLAAVGVLLGALQVAHAQTIDPGKHFRSGVWDQWIFWTVPGPSAFAAVQRVVERANAARGTAGLPLLNADPGYPLIFAVYEENDARGPDGKSLADATPNRESFLATFVDLDDGSSVVFFLTDQIRSNAELTAKGVPGVPGTFTASTERNLQGDGTTRTELKWNIATASGDAISFKAEYGDDAVAFRGRTPGAAAYLANGVGLTLALVYSALPTQLFLFYERNQSAWYDLPTRKVEVKLAGHSHDADVDAMYNDAHNTPIELIELKRVVRIQRQ